MASIRYTFREPLPLRNAADADPDAIGKALEKIKRDNAGRLTPTIVWQTAKQSPRNPLHKLYDWDVRRAAEAHWTDVSRTIIRCVQLVDEDVPEDEPKPAFISVSDKQGISYRSVGEVMQSAELQLSALNSLDRDIAALEKRARSLNEICASLREAREKIAARVAKLESRAAA